MASVTPFNELKSNTKICVSRSLEGFKMSVVRIKILEQFQLILLKLFSLMNGKLNFMQDVEGFIQA